MRATAMVIVFAATGLFVGRANADWAMGQYWADIEDYANRVGGSPWAATGCWDGDPARIGPSEVGYRDYFSPWSPLSWLRDPRAAVLTLYYFVPIQWIGNGVTVHWWMEDERVDATVFAAYSLATGGLTEIGTIRYQPPPVGDPGDPFNPDPFNPEDPFDPGDPFVDPSLGDIRTPGSHYTDHFTLPSGLPFAALNIVIVNNRTPGDLLFGDTGEFAVDAVCGLLRVGGTAEDPLLPTGLDSAAGRFVFRAGPSDSWFDPPWTSEFTFEIESGRLFTAIPEFPAGFGEEMEVWVDGGLLVDSLGAGDAVDFVALLGHGVSSFVVKGIDPDGPDDTVDAALADAFPLKLAFDAEFADVTMTATPEPATIGLLALGGLAVIRRRNRR